MTRQYAHLDLVLKIFCQNVSMHNFLLSMVLPITLPAATINVPNLLEDFFFLLLLIIMTFLHQQFALSSSSFSSVHVVILVFFFFFFFFFFSLSLIPWICINPSSPSPAAWAGSLCLGPLWGPEELFEMWCLNASQNKGSEIMPGPKLREGSPASDEICQEPRRGHTPLHLSPDKKKMSLH